MSARVDETNKQKHKRADAAREATGAACDECRRSGSIFKSCLLTLEIQRTEESAAADRQRPTEDVASQRFKVGLAKIHFADVSRLSDYLLGLTKLRDGKSSVLEISPL